MKVGRKPLVSKLSEKLQARYRFLQHLGFSHKAMRIWGLYRDMGFDGFVLLINEALRYRDGHRKVGVSKTRACWENESGQIISRELHDSTKKGMGTAR